VSETRQVVVPAPFGCAGCLVTILLVIAMITSISTPWGRFSINLFHNPGIYLTK
jgi:hypothetical protein